MDTENSSRIGRESKNWCSAPPPPKVSGNSIFTSHAWGQAEEIEKETEEQEALLTEEEANRPTEPKEKDEDEVELLPIEELEDNE